MMTISILQTMISAIPLVYCPWQPHTRVPTSNPRATQFVLQQIYRPNCNCSDHLEVYLRHMML